MKALGTHPTGGTRGQDPKITILEPDFSFCTKNLPNTAEILRQSVLLFPLGITSGFHYTLLEK